MEKKSSGTAENPVVNYFKGSFQELKKVTWPTHQQAIKLTIIVLGFCVVSAVIVGVFDLAFNRGYQELINLSK